MAVLLVAKWFGSVVVKYAIATDITQYGFDVQHDRGKTPITEVVEW